MSSDANNGDHFLTSIQQAENALAYIRNEDGTPKDGFCSVTVLALWDGPGETNPSVHGASETKLLELGMGFHDSFNINEGLYERGKKNDWTFSSNTIDLSSKASWLFSKDRQEVNMGAYETLEAFLKFAATYYKGNTTILSFGDHGSGPELEIELEETDAPSENSYSNRLIMFDSDTNESKQYAMRTCDVVKALESSGYTGENRGNLIIEDLCSSGSIEEAYGLKGMADYFMASPNTTWRDSIGYYHFITNLRKNKDFLTVCREEIDNYAEKWGDETDATLTLADLSDEQKFEEIKACTSELGNLIAENYADSEMIEKQLNFNKSQTSESFKDLGWIAYSLSKNASYPLLNSAAEKLCSALESIIVKVYGAGYYYTDHENGSFFLDSSNYGMYADGKCFGLSITTLPVSVYSKKGEYLQDVKWNQCTLFGKDNSWQKVIDLCGEKS